MKTTLAQALARLPAAATAQYPEGAPSVSVMRHGTMQVKLFTPATNLNRQDRQVPHEQDELYVVQSGTAQFTVEGHTVTAQPGDVLFVAAGQHHRFTEVSPDFLTWVVFYGPPGGENSTLVLD